VVVYYTIALALFMQSSYWEVLRCLLEGLDWLRGPGEANHTVFDEGGYPLGRTEVGLMDDPGFALDASALDDVVVEGVGFLLGDEGSHTG
jgi:hypothetical protein